MPFKPYDPVLGPTTYRRTLPQWQQPGVTYFVTFRLADSLPIHVLQELETEKLSWLVAHGLGSLEDLAICRDELRWEFAKIFNARLHEGIDAGHGECWLRQRELREEVVDALRHWQGNRLDLDLAVVMPNHVHALLTPGPEWALEKLLHSVKRFSARAINAKLGRKGALWQDENFDHIVRNAAQLEHFRDYIRNNPVKAGLKAEDFWLGSGQREESGTGLERGTGFRSA